MAVAVTNLGINQLEDKTITLELQEGD